MAKTFVTYPADGTRVPFLRGILTRSLSDAGIEFEEAYKLASNVRQTLSDVDEISADTLRTQVATLLQERFESVAWNPAGSHPKRRKKPAGGYINT
jgi:2-phosphoglycerate kinase